MLWIYELFDIFKLRTPVKWCGELVTWNIWIPSFSDNVNLKAEMWNVNVNVPSESHNIHPSFMTCIYCIYIYIDIACVACLHIYISQVTQCLHNVYCTALHPFSFFRNRFFKELSSYLSLGQAPCTRVNRVFNLVWFTAHKHRSHIRWVLSWAMAGMGWLFVVQINLV